MKQENVEKELNIQRENIPEKNVCVLFVSQRRLKSRSIEFCGKYAYMRQCFLGSYNNGNCYIIYA